MSHTGIRRGGGGAESERGRVSRLACPLRLASHIPRDRYARPELYYSAFRDELVANNYSLVPSRYIEFIDRDTEIDYKSALAEAGSKAGDLLARQTANAKQLASAFKALGVKL